MKTKHLQIKTNVRTGAVPCTATTWPYLECYIGKTQDGVPEPQRESENMYVGDCLKQVRSVSSDYACYIA